MFACQDRAEPSFRADLAVDLLHIELGRSVWLQSHRSVTTFSMAMVAFGVSAVAQTKSRAHLPVTLACPSATYAPCRAE